MVGRDVIRRCRLEVCWACFTSCLLLESCVCRSCGSITGHSSWRQPSRSPLQLQFLWATTAPYTGVWRRLFCKTRNWNIQSEDTRAKGMEYWEQKPRENGGGESAEGPGEGSFFLLWFVLHVLCLQRLRLPRWVPREARPASCPGGAEWLCGTKALGFIAVLLLEESWNPFHESL